MRAFGHLVSAGLLGVVGAWGCGPTVVWYGKSPDRGRTVAVVDGGGEQRIRIDGKEGPAFCAIGIEALVFSPDSRRLAYPARTNEGWALVVDGSVGPSWSGIGEIVWSDDSAHIAYAAERDGRWLVIKDGREGPVFDALRARSLRLSKDGRHIAYAADEDGRVVVVADGVKSLPYEGVAHLRISPSGAVAFVGRKKTGTVVVLDGKESSTYEDIADMAFSPGGTKLVWTARRNGYWHVVTGGAESERYDRVSRLTWATRTGSLAYAVGRGEEEWVVVDGKPGAPYDGILPGSLVFDESGGEIAYGAHRGGTFRVVTSAGESPPYDSIEAPVFVGSSKAVAHIASRGQASFLVLDGHPARVSLDATQLSISPDGRRFLHLARAGARAEVVFGEVRGGPCGQGRCSPVVTRTERHDIVVGGTLAWSPASFHSGYLAGDRTAKGFFLMIDGERASRLDMEEVMARLSLSPDLAGTLAGDEKLLSEWVRAEIALVERRERSMRRAQ